MNSLNLPALPYYHYRSYEYRHIRYRIQYHIKGVKYFSDRARIWANKNPDKVKKRWQEFNAKQSSVLYRHYYYLKNKYKLNAQKKRYYLEHQDIAKARSRKYYRDNILKIKADTSKYYQTWKEYNKYRTIFHYSDGKMCCNTCGENIIELLTLDHINGSGNKHRKSLGNPNLYTWLRKNNYPDGYQILCYNCNLVKNKVTPERYVEIIKDLQNRKHYYNFIDKNNEVQF